MKTALSPGAAVATLARLAPADRGPLTSRTVTVQARVLAVAALLATAAYLVWRLTSTLVVESWWLSLPLLLLEVHAFATLALHTFGLWDINAGPPQRTVAAPSGKVAILIPTYNEPVEVLLPTIAAAVAVRLEHETWVLDDGARPDVAALAQRLGARYLARLERSHAKAGNLNHALSYIEAEFVAVLDADHVARPELLARTLGYFDDSRVALVQTPQDFYNELSFEHATRGRRYQEQSLFYRAIQPGKNRWKAAFWCGTGAVLRTAALRDIGGVATGTVTEDIQTTIRLHRAGWKSVYHNEVLARGLAAATGEQYATQRFRWCTGAMQVLRSERPLAGPNLALVQRLAYAGTLLGWFDAWRTLGYILLPIAVLFTGGTPIRADARTFALAFATTFLFQQLALWRLGRGLQRPLPAMVFEFVRLAPTLRATTALVTGGSRDFRVTHKGASRRRRRVPALLLALFTLSVLAWCWYLATVAGRTATVFSDAWVAHGAAFWLIVNTLILAMAITRIASRRYAGDRRMSVRMGVRLAGTLNGEHVVSVGDLSLTGALLHGECEIASVGDRMHLRLHLSDGAADVTARVRQVGRGRGESWLGVEFVDVDVPAQARLALAAFAAGASVQRAVPEHIAEPSFAA